jgi:hypothetical protein
MKLLQLKGNSKKIVLIQLIKNIKKKPVQELTVLLVSSTHELLQVEVGSSISIFKLKKVYKKNSSRFRLRDEFLNSLYGFLVTLN